MKKTPRPRKNNLAGNGLYIQALLGFAFKSDYIMRR